MIAGELSPQELDMLARLAVSEGGSTPVSQAGVLSVVRNRLASGKFGTQLADVVTAPSQFEAWDNGNATKVSPSSAGYQSALNLAQAIFQGGAPDPTNGATHYFSPAGQAALSKVDGRALIPNWAASQQPLASIGGNVYYAPSGQVPPAAYGGSVSAPTPPAGALGNGGNSLAPPLVGAPNSGPARPVLNGQNGQTAQQTNSTPMGALTNGLAPGLSSQQSLLSAVLQKYIGNPIRSALGVPMRGGGMGGVATGAPAVGALGSTPAPVQGNAALPPPAVPSPGIAGLPSANYPYNDAGAASPVSAPQSGTMMPQGMVGRAATSSPFGDLSGASFGPQASTGGSPDVMAALSSLFGGGGFG